MAGLGAKQLELAIGLIDQKVKRLVRELMDIFTSDDAEELRYLTSDTPTPKWYREGYCPSVYVLRKEDLPKVDILLKQSYSSHEHLVKFYDTIFMRNKEEILVMYRAWQEKQAPRVEELMLRKREYHKQMDKLQALADEAKSKVIFLGVADDLQSVIDSITL